ncbi:MAG: glycosyltransferase [Leifsonia sp.]|uniref:glycosyltransferase family 2 protein n=1 Tax=Leifsonia sp. TaxID=1870902 RepID=UPI003F7D8C30
MNSRPGVTVVVPVYGDLESLSACVEALKTTVDFSRHAVMLVNDVGPDADEIEAALLEAIDGLDGFEYHRNARNLGFVGTCNRAALELDRSDRDILLLNSDTVPTPGFVDAMSDVLYADPRHGVVTARSNSATIASLPYRLADPAAGRDIERTRLVYDAIVSYLPDYTVPPVAMGFCFLTRRELIRKYGLFAEEFAPGYGEENDYCLRLNQAGYLSVMTNRALVFHEGSKSFQSVGRNEIRDAHERLLDRKYPFYRRAVRNYNYFGVRAAEWFADLLVPRDGRRKAEVDLRGLATAIPEQSLRSVALAGLRRDLIEPLAAGFEVQVVADPEDAVLAGLDPAVVRLVSSTPDPVEIFDVGVVLADGVRADQLTAANRRHLRWVGLTLLDAVPISWRRVSELAEVRVAASDLEAHADGWVRLHGSSGPETIVRGEPAAGAPAEAIADLVHGTDDLSTTVPRLERRWSHLTAVEAYLAGRPAKPAR